MLLSILQKTSVQRWLSVTIWQKTSVQRWPDSDNLSKDHCPALSWQCQFVKRPLSSVTWQVSKDQCPALSWQCQYVKRSVSSVAKQCQKTSVQRWPDRDNSSKDQCPVLPSSVKRPVSSVDLTGTIRQRTSVQCCPGSVSGLELWRLPHWFSFWTTTAF
jgi:hypothetical protein